jgi:hypothetical protein
MLDAGIVWLNRVAGLNPATSHVIREWDRSGAANWEVRSELLAILKEERLARSQNSEVRNQESGARSQRSEVAVSC